MELYAKIDKQFDIYSQVVYVNELLSKQNFYLNFLVLVFLIFIALKIMK